MTISGTSKSLGSKSLGSIGLATIGLASMLLAEPGPARAEACHIAQAILGEPDQKTGEVGTEELRRILADASAVVIDTRTRAEFDAGHIPGAYNLDAPPAEQVSTVDRLVNGDRAAALVLYCNGPYCQASRRLAEQLVVAGFTNVRRYQLGIPVWRALGGPTAIELDGIVRVFGVDRTAVFVDARSAEAFAAGSLDGARSAPVGEMAAGKPTKLPLPEDDFNRRVVVFGVDAAQARALADRLGKRPWHNVSYFPGTFEALAGATGKR